MERVMAVQGCRKNKGRGDPGQEKPVVRLFGNCRHYSLCGLGFMCTLPENTSRNPNRTRYLHFLP